jgi:hypothetical protein
MVCEENQGLESGYLLRWLNGSSGGHWKDNRISRSKQVYFQVPKESEIESEDERRLSERKGMDYIRVWSSGGGTLI